MHPYSRRYVQAECEKTLGTGRDGATAKCTSSRVAVVGTAYARTLAVSALRGLGSCAVGGKQNKTQSVGEHLRTTSTKSRRSGYRRQ